MKSSGRSDCCQSKMKQLSVTSFKATLCNFSGCITTKGQNKRDAVANSHRTVNKAIILVIFMLHILGQKLRHCCFKKLECQL